MPTRRTGREHALQALYSIEVGHREPADALDEVTGTDADSPHRGFVRDLVLGTLERREECDAQIVPLLEGWTIERLPTIDRLLLEMGAFELTHLSTPAAVVINEAVELAKKFSTEDSGRFVNGVLARLGRAHGRVSEKA